MAKRQSTSQRLKARYIKEAKGERARGTMPRFEDEKKAPPAGGKKGSKNKPPAKTEGGSK